MPPQPVGRTTEYETTADLWAAMQGSSGTPSATNRYVTENDPGRVGPQGASGAPGSQGIQGVQGNPGASGATGATGPPGTTLHSGLTDVSADQHHPQAHASDHASGGAQSLAGYYAALVHNHAAYAASSHAATHNPASGSDPLDFSAGFENRIPLGAVSGFAAHKHTGGDGSASGIPWAALAGIPATFTPITHGSGYHTGIIGDHLTNLGSVGTNTHATIDSHLAATSTFHGLTAANVPNLNAANTFSASGNLFSGQIAHGNTTAHATRLYRATWDPTAGGGQYWYAADIKCRPSPTAHDTGGFYTALAGAGQLLTSFNVGTVRGLWFSALHSAATGTITLLDCVYGIAGIGGVAGSAATVTGANPFHSYQQQPTTGATGFITNFRHFYAEAAAVGGGSQVNTNTYGFYADKLSAAYAGNTWGAYTQDRVYFEDTSVNTALVANQKSTGPIFDAQDNGTSVFKVDDGSKIGFFNVTTVARQAHIANPTGGVVVDAESRTAITALTAMVEAYGLTATS